LLDLVNDTLHWTKPLSSAILRDKKLFRRYNDQILNKGETVRSLFLALSLAVATQSGPAVAQAQSPGRAYTVNAGDEIEVYVWGEERLQRQIRILPDGSFSFPLIGRLVVAGKTLPEIESAVTQGLQSQYRGQVPQVTVSVKMPAGMQFSVAGRVKGPGTFTPGRYVNVLEALTIAGGPAEFANLDNVTIIRKSGNGLITIKARLSGVFKGNVPSGAAAQTAIPSIETGDTVIVP
jgi:polysaccharide biosynthesis/export protein